MKASGYLFCVCGKIYKTKKFAILSILSVQFSVMIIYFIW